MNLYPYSSAFVLTDTLFNLYGGDATLGTSQQRKLAYLLSEKAVRENLKTFLQPTIVSGTFAQVTPTSLLDLAYINAISVVSFIDTEETIYFTASGTSSEYFSLRNDTYGIVDLHYLVSICNNCNHGGVLTYPYQVQIVYNAGLSSGTVYQLQAKGIDEDTTVVFYGDKNNCWAGYALWVFQLFCFKDTRIMNGGRKKWIDEGRELSKVVPSYPKTNYQASPRNDRQIQAFRNDVQTHLEQQRPLG